MYLCNSGSESRVNWKRADPMQTNFNQVTHGKYHVTLLYAAKVFLT